MDIPAAMLEALDGKSTTLFYKFKQPLADEDMGKADFLVNILDTVLSGGMLEDGGSYYFGAAWYPSDREDDYILGLLLESRDSEEETGIDMDSPEAKEIIKQVAEVFGLDPAMLGGDPEGGDYPIDDIIGGADGPVEVVTKPDGTVVTTWDGGGSVELR